MGYSQNTPPPRDQGPAPDARSNRCFACGPANPHGLHLQIRQSDDGGWQARFVPQEYHCGWPGVMHGGLICTLLDEIMNYTTYGTGLVTATARLSVDFHRPVPIGQEILVRGRALRRTRRRVDAEGELLLPDGTVAARGKATLAVLTPEQQQRFGLAGAQSPDAQSPNVQRPNVQRPGAQSPDVPSPDVPSASERTASEQRAGGQSAPEQSAREQRAAE
ncbi:MAG: PaaI family thioesterase [Firmicutes bacterium]|nr:PaaI family thioesterase [Bacillota bacterium]